MSCVGVSVSVIPSVLTEAPVAGVAAPDAASAAGQDPVVSLIPPAPVLTGVCCPAVRHGACLTLRGIGIG